jgi:hypothetical protein
MNKITPADISDPQELIARAKALSVEFKTPIAPGFRDHMDNLQFSDAADALEARQR